MMAGYFKRLAHYSRWANRRLYEACASLPEAEYKRDRKAFFGSIHRTLNHILVGDRIWLGRIERIPHGITSLDEELYSEFATLRSAREAEDARISSLVEGYKDDDMGTIISYQLVSIPGASMETPLSEVLGHLFNHATHHRGQVHNMLSQAEVPPPPLDLIFFLREAG